MSLSKQTNPPTEWPFMLRKFLTPKNDIAFKKIFGTERNDVGNQYIVEMQVSERDDFVKRAQYYAARAYSSELVEKI